jgi:alanyl-tRNA synthetase
VKLVDQVLKAEEERFAETLDSGMKVFEQIAAQGQEGDGRRWRYGVHASTTPTAFRST